MAVRGQPRRECRRERTLDGVLDKLDVAHADLVRELRHEPAVLMAKEVLDETRGMAGVVGHM